MYPIDISKTSSVSKPPSKGSLATGQIHSKHRPKSANRNSPTLSFYMTAIKASIASTAMRAGALRRNVVLRKTNLRLLTWPCLMMFGVRFEVPTRRQRGPDLRGGRLGS